MATQFEPRGEPVSVGRILTRSFAVIAANPLVILGIAFLFGAVPSVILNYFVQEFSAGLVGQENGVRDGVFLAIGSGVFNFVLAMIVQGALVRATIAYTEGRRAGFSESLTAGLRVALPLVVLSILVGLGVMVGFFFLFVPGVILYLIWSVASPALVEERVGVFGAMSRSRFLSRGARWKIFGLELVVLIVLWIGSAIVGFLLIGSSGAVQVAASGQATLPVMWFIGTAIVSTLFTTFWSTVQTSLYVDLRNWKDGPQATQLEDVFA